MLTFSCSACKQPLQAPLSASGKKAKCPRCQQVVPIPAAPTPVLSAPQAAAASPSLSSTASEAPRSARLRIIRKEVVVPGAAVSPEAKGSDQTPVESEKSVPSEPRPPEPRPPEPPLLETPPPSAAMTDPDAPTVMPEVQPGTTPASAAPTETLVSGTPAASEEHPFADVLTPAETPDELGRLGGYRILKVVGQGGMGVVFLAEDQQLRRKVALKVLLPKLAANPAHRKRFLREARATAAIEHDHIVSIYAVGEDRGVPFLAMSLLQGESLDARIRRERQLPITEVLRIGRETAEGLAAAHERGLIHRDIKPGNLWLEGRRQRVKILDFGLARELEQQEGGTLTQFGTVLGTPAFMSPEQARGAKVDARSDLFSLGCVLYRLATGQLAFSKGDALQTLMALSTEDPRPPRELNPEISPELNELILRLLARSPGDRLASAASTAEALELLERRFSPATGSSQHLLPVARRVEPPPTAPTEAFPSARKPRPRRWLPLVGGLLLLALLALLGCWLGGLFSPPPPARGALVIDTSDPTVEVVIHQGEQVLQRTRERRIELLAGDYEIQLVASRAGQRLFPSAVTIRPDEASTIKVLEPTPGP